MWKNLILLLSLAGCTSGASVSPQAYARILEPPAQYVRPYRGDLQVRVVDREVADKACPHGIACAFPFGSDRCLILINVDYLAYRAALMRHETAHCLGWPGTHPRD